MRFRVAAAAWQRPRRARPTTSCAPGANAACPVCVSISTARAARNAGPGTDDLQSVARLAGRHGFHVEIIAPLRVIAARAGEIAALDTACVIDHYGLPGDARPDDADGRTLMDLVRRDHIWMKLSSPYRHPDRPLEVNPDPAWLGALLAACPDRCVWGSDWPHPPPHETHGGPDTVAPWRPISYAALFETFAEAVGSQKVLTRILRDNPARLYGFGSQTPA